LKRAFVPEVYQVTDGLHGDAHIVDELRLVFGRKLGHSLQLYQQATEHNKIWNVPLFQGPAFVDAFDLFLGAERYASHFQFDFEALLVNLFRESVTAVVLNFERCAHKPIPFIFVNLSFHKVEPLILAHLPLMRTRKDKRRQGIFLNLSFHSFSSLSQLAFISAD